MTELEKELTTKVVIEDIHSIGEMIVDLAIPDITNTVLEKLMRSS